MIRIFLLLAMGYSVSKYYQYNNFDEPDPTLPVVLDSLNVNNSWQIAEPNKTVFKDPYSPPNVILTDSLVAYSPNDSSSFIIELEEYYFWSGLPFIIVQWQQWVDAEENVDGAVVEYAFESPDQWINVFTDTLTKPWAMTSTDPVILFNGQQGFSGTSEHWEYTGFCWSEAFIPEPVEKMYLRFTFYSDSTDTEQDGWMIDHIEAFPSFVDYTNEARSHQQLSLNIFPNPTDEYINISWEETLQNDQAPSRISLLNPSGKVVKEARIALAQKQIGWNIADLPSGIYIVYLQSKDGLLATHRVVKP